MGYRFPPSLKQGDTIGVMAPSSRVETADLEAGVKALTDRGYNVFIHPQSFEQLHQSAGKTDQKVKALHDLAREPSIKAIVFAGGGNRALHVLDHLDYALIQKYPKIYMGFSDCTALLNAITAKSGIVTYHGPVVKRLPSNLQIDENFALLEGRTKEITMHGAQILKRGAGSAKGILFGGNLSLVRALREDDLPKSKGGILFLEDVSEEYSKIDRDFAALRRSGLLEKAGALVLGQFTDLRDSGTPFGFSFEDIVLEHTDGLDIPVLINAPFGHEKSLNLALPVGATVLLDDTTLILR